MKQFQILSLLLVFSLFIFACGDDDEPKSETQFTEWQLVEFWLSPGAGGPDFQSIQSDKVIQLWADSTFTCNGDICSMSHEVTMGSSGIYSDQFLIADSCNTNSSEIRYDLNADELIIHFPCFEPCQHRYIPK